MEANTIQATCSKAPALMTKVRVSFLGLGFGMALLLAPSAHAQEFCPDHFTETGVEPGCAARNIAQPTAHATRAKQARVAASAAKVNSEAGAVRVAVAVADKNRPAIAQAPKR